MQPTSLSRLLTRSAIGHPQSEFSRRSMLQTVAGLGLSFLMPAMSARAAQKRKTERPKSLITLWMQGAQSQLETWDPHPGTKIGGDTRAIKTTIPGLEISDFLPQMADNMEGLSVIRSLTSKELSLIHI